MLIGLALTSLIGYLFFTSSVGTMSDVVENSVSSKFDDLFKKYGAKYGIDWKILKRIAWIESTIGENPRVKKGLLNPNDIAGSTSYDKKSWGLMQMTLETARDYDKFVTAVKLNNPDYSIDLSARHIKMLKTLFSKERDIIMSYNHGQGNQKNFVQQEKNGTLELSEFPAGREYWKKYNIAKGII